MKQDKVLIDSIGPNDNVLCITPPMCFTVTDARHVVQLIDKYLKEIESAACPDQLVEMGESLVEPTVLHEIPAQVLFEPMREDTDSDEGPSAPKMPRRSIPDDDVD